MLDRLRTLARALAGVGLLLLSGHSALTLAQEAPVAAGPPYRVGSGVTRPDLLSATTKPVYTEIARKARVQGIVIVEAIIDEQGDVTETRVLKGLPMGLDQSAVEAVKTWKFKPATLEGRPVPVYYVLTVNFQVSDGSSFYGPRFLRFLKQNPEFEEHLQRRRFPEALALLDRLAAARPGDPDIPLARTQLLLAQGRLDDAWQEAASYRGPEPFEILHCVAVAALDQASAHKTPDADRRTAILEMGLEAETMAIAASPDNPAAIYFKSRLLREKAALAADPEARQALIDEADRLLKRAVELQPKPERPADPQERVPQRGS